MISKLEHSSLETVQKSTPHSFSNFQSTESMGQSVSSSSKSHAGRHNLEGVRAGRTKVNSTCHGNLSGIRDHGVVGADELFLRRKSDTIHRKGEVMSSSANTSRALDNNPVAQLPKVTRSGPDSAPHRSGASTPSLVR
jgi:hypothetical protein